MHGSDLTDWLLNTPTKSAQCDLTKTSAVPQKNYVYVFLTL